MSSPITASIRVVLNGPENLLEGAAACTTTSTPFIGARRGDGRGVPAPYPQKERTAGRVAGNPCQRHLLMLELIRLEDDKASWDGYSRPT